jgi:hypothetical protein
LFLHCSIWGENREQYAIMPNFRGKHFAKSLQNVANLQQEAMCSTSETKSSQNSGTFVA